MLVEIWQANAAGRYNHPADRQDKAARPELPRLGPRPAPISRPGFTRFETIKPGPGRGPQGRKPMAPHVNFWIAARGINIGLVHPHVFRRRRRRRTRTIRCSNMIEQAVRRETLIAQREERDGESVYTFDIHLQGDRETVFFDI